MLILIKGAGDIATGIAVRLKNSGMQVVMTEIAHSHYSAPFGCFFPRCL